MPDETGDKNIIRRVVYLEPRLITRPPSVSSIFNQSPAPKLPADGSMKWYKVTKDYQYAPHAAVYDGDIVFVMEWVDDDLAYVERRGVFFNIPRDILELSD